MADYLLTTLSMGYIQRALFCGTLLAAITALLGVYLCYNRFAMVGHGLSHVCFGGVGVILFLRSGYWSLPLSVVAICNGPMFFLLLPVAIGAGWGILWIIRMVRVEADSAIAVIGAGGIALGSLCAAAGSGLGQNVSSYLFGSLLLLGPSDLYFLLFISLIVAGVMFSFYPHLLIWTTTPEVSRIYRINRNVLELTLITLTAVVTVAGIQLAGTLLVSSMFVLPVMVAACLARSFRSLLLWSVCTGVAGFWLGMVGAIVWDFPPGPAVILVELILLSILKVFSYLRTRQKGRSCA